MRGSLPGYSLAIMLVIGALLVGGGLAAYSSFRTQVLGVSSQKSGESLYNRQSGVAVKVLAPFNSWNLDQYLCKSLEECETSETSGVWWSSVSGGATNEDGHEVVIESASTWQDYNFMKLVSRSVTFSGSQNSGVQLQVLDSGDANYSIVPSNKGFYLVEFNTK